MQELAENLRAHLKAFWRFRWYAVASAWIIALVGWVAVYKMPERYEASARLYADTQSVLRPLLSGVAVQPNLDQMVGMMSQTLISGPNLEKVIQMAGLDTGLKTEEDRAKLISRLRTEISIKSAGKENLYGISCVDRDPQVAQRLVQSLLTLFVEGSLTGNRKDSDSARNFIDEQLTGYRDKLVEAENSITVFKRRHLGLMPGEGPGYFAQLGDARTALNRAALDLKEAENSRDSIKKRLAVESERSPLPEEKAVGAAAPVESELDRRITALEQKLDTLRLSYTEQHPDIVALVPTIAQLKEQRKAEAEDLRRRQEVQAKLSGGAPTALQTKNPVYQQLSASLTTAEANVAVMSTRVAEYGRRYAELQSAANAMPQIEAEYAQLTRDYEVNKARYAELLKRRDSAQISGDMGDSDAAMTFRVIDPPRVVRNTPSPRLLMTLVLLIALAGGVGVTFLVNQLKPTINNEHRLKEITGLRILGTVAMSMTASQKSRYWRSLGAVAISIVGLFSAYSAIMLTLMNAVSRT